MALGSIGWCVCGPAEIALHQFNWEPSVANGFIPHPSPQQAIRRSVQGKAPQVCICAQTLYQLRREGCLFAEADHRRVILVEMPEPTTLPCFGSHAISQP
eukprot:586541-Prorocentrum_minimum.AAC.1